jgi:hypothetical protein
VALEQQQQELALVSQARPRALHWGWEPRQNSETRPEAAPQEPRCHLDLHSGPAQPEQEQVLNFCIRSKSMVSKGRTPLQ